jgi:2-methylcitrate dehydratase PrpD
MTSLETAAFVNGFLAEVLDWQDTNMPARIHNASGTIPAVLAVSERRRLSGSAALRAIVAGYEVGTRIGVAIQPSHWYNGFQATGSVGAIGAAAGVGALLGFDAGQMADVLGVAGFIAPVSNGDGVFHGFSIKPAHGGMAAQAGVQAGRLVQSGFAAGPLEGLPPRQHGFMNVTSDEIVPEVIARNLGSEWLMRDCAHKYYPVGLLNIGPVQVALDLAREYDIHPEQVESIDATSYTDTWRYVGRHFTTTESSPADAQLSLAYAVAVALSDREYGVRQLTRGRLSDPLVHQLAARVTTYADAEMDKTYPREWPVQLTIHLRDGRSVSRRLDKVVGCPAHPMSDAEIVDKFRRTAGPILGDAMTERVTAAAFALENVEDMGEFVAWLKPQAGGRR